MPFSEKVGGHDRKVGNIDSSTKSAKCSIPKQTKYIYKKVELGSLINKETMRDEIDLDAELDRVDEDSGDKNTYKELIVNNTIKIDSASSQMEQWSMLVM